MLKNHRRSHREKQRFIVKEKNQYEVKASKLFQYKKFDI